MIHKTPVGILEPRKGGHPMKLTFFVSPYDLIDRKTKTALTLSADGKFKLLLSLNSSHQSLY